MRCCRLPCSAWPLRSLSYENRMELLLAAYVVVRFTCELPTPRTTFFTYSLIGSYRIGRIVIRNRRRAEMCAWRRSTNRRGP